MDPALPFTPGVDPSGVVEAVGEGVASLKIGDRVAGTTTLATFGGYAELVVLRESRVSVVPDGVDFPTATVVRRHFGMAHSQVERRAELQAGETVLVMGAAGALSTCIIQLAREAGAASCPWKVIAGAGSDERVAAATAMGADYGVNYRDGDLVTRRGARRDGGPRRRPGVRERRRPAPLAEGDRVPGDRRASADHRDARGRRHPAPGGRAPPLPEPPADHRRAGVERAGGRLRRRRAPGRRGGPLPRADRPRAAAVAGRRRVPARRRERGHAAR